MSILIRGMEMPKNCKNCMDARLNVAVSLFGAMCPFCKKIFLADIDIKKQRLDDCPLIELPPHGRLGDLDALYEEISNGNKAYNGIEGYDGEYPNIGNVDDCLDAIKYADTVIEAEGSETRWK